MVTLHGFPYSNYYNVVKHVLLHKGIPFEEDLQYGAGEDYLTVSPLGKVPAITTEQGGHLSESSVCCDYLEEYYPDEPLYPVDTFARNYVRQIMKISELYLELPCRRMLGFVFSDTEAPEEIKAEVRAVAERGIGAMNRLCEFEPYLAGGEMTMADIYLRYVMTVVDIAATSKLDWDIGAQIDGLKEWQLMMADSDISRRIDADRDANAEGFFTMIKERFGVG
jgi:glutathione S-transferase